MEQDDCLGSQLIAALDGHLLLVSQHRILRPTTMPRACTTAEDHSAGRFAIATATVHFTAIRWRWGLRWGKFAFALLYKQ